VIIISTIFFVSHWFETPCWRRCDIAPKKTPVQRQKTTSLKLSKVYIK